MSHERPGGGSLTDRLGDGGPGRQDDSGRTAGGNTGTSPDSQPIHRDDCYALVAGFAFVGALNYAEAFAKPRAYEFAEAIRDRVPDCDCFTAAATSTDTAADADATALAAANG